MKMRHILIFLPLLIIAALLFFTHRLNPLEAGPAGILFVFILLYGLSLSICFLAVYLGPGLLVRLGIKKRQTQVSVRKSYYVASVIAALPILLITIQAVNQLRILDVLLVAVLLALAVFYINRRF